MNYGENIIVNTKEQKKMKKITEDQKKQLIAVQQWLSQDGESITPAQLAKKIIQREKISATLKYC